MGFTSFSPRVLALSGYTLPFLKLLVNKNFCIIKILFDLKTQFSLKTYFLNFLIKSILTKEKFLLQYFLGQGNFRQGVCDVAAEKQFLPGHGGEFKKGCH